MRKPERVIRYGRLHGPAIEHDEPAPRADAKPEQTDLERYRELLAEAETQDAEPTSFVERFRFEEAQKRAEAEWKKRFDVARAYLTRRIEAKELDASFVPLPQHPALGDDDND